MADLPRSGAVVPGSGELAELFNKIRRITELRFCAMRRLDIHEVPAQEQTQHRPSEGLGECGDIVAYTEAWQEC